MYQFRGKGISVTINLMQNHSAELAKQKTAHTMNNIHFTFCILACQKKQPLLAPLSPYFLYDLPYDWKQLSKTTP